MVKVVHMVTVSKSIDLMAGQLEYLRDNGFEIHLVSSKGSKGIFNGIVKHEIEMKREISLIHDFLSLYKIIKLFRKLKPDIVNAGTPKAALLGIIAAFICRVPNRIYTCRGLRLETLRGLKKYILKMTEILTSKLATEVLAISPSLRLELIDRKLVKPNKVKVLGNGSSNGIDESKFVPEKDSAKLWALKKELGIRKEDKVIGYFGRLVKDKGVEDLYVTFQLLKQDNPRLKLLLIGSLEIEDSISQSVLEGIKTDPQIILLPHQKKLLLYYQVLDLFIFPTHREGFGNVSIEAQLLGTPVICSDATGARDTLKEGVSGLIFKKQDVNDMYKKIELLLNNMQLKKEMSLEATQFVKDNFSNKIIWRELIDFYNKLSN